MMGINTQTENNTTEDKTQDAVDNAVKALIALASSAIEADQIVQDFKADCRGKDTEPLLKSKYDYVTKIFNINQESRRFCHPADADDFELAATKYYSLLSVLILRKWG